MRRGRPGLPRADPADGVAGRSVRLRVLHVITTSQRRGAESFGVELGRALTSRGHAADPVALSPAAAGSVALPVPVLGGTSLGPRTLRRLRARARTVDVVIAHGSRTLPACVLALIGARVPIVYVNIGDPLYWARTRLRRLRVRVFLSRVDRVVARSAQSASRLATGLGVPPAKIRVIGNARDSTAFVPAGPEQRARARAELVLGRAGSVAAYVGALSPEKRVDVAIEAVAGTPGVTLLVAGDGPERAALEALAAARLPGRARFLGAVADPYHVLAASDALLLTSDSEGLPGVLIEAGMAGLPVVASDVGFVADIVQHDVTGLLVPPGDSTATAAALMDALRRREQLGRQARQHCVRNFELAGVVDAWETVLADVVGPDRPGS